MKHYMVCGLSLLSAACGMSPLSNHIEVGKDPFVIFVGEGIDRRTDLFVVQPGGGRIFQVTFTNVIESNPHLVRDGSLVAFLRMKDTLADTPRQIVVLNLFNTSEQLIPNPEDAGQPTALAWSDNAEWLYVRTDRGVWRVAVVAGSHAAERVGEDDLASADSALTGWAGRPRFARIISCPSGGVCLINPKGDTVNVSNTGRDAFEWGTDSLGWFENDELMVRSLGAGTLRKVQWKSAPARPREGSYSGGNR